MITCSCQPCDREAIIKCSWGSKTLPLQKANLCEEHKEDLYNRLNPLIKWGLNNAWLICEEPKE